MRLPDPATMFCFRRAHRLIACGLIVFAVFTLSGCESIGYYAHVSSGQLSLLGKREPVDDVIASLAGNTDPEAVALSERLALSKRVLEFASTELGLEVGDRYGSYVALDRDAVVWNLVAAPELSLDAHTWCYPFVGCAPYRGFFDRDRAEQARARLAADGLDTYVGGVSAYSTLGWFDDPILSTFVDMAEADFIDLLIHELAHSRVWVKGDAPFNEAFASFVGREATRAWYAAEGRSADYEAHLAREADWSRARSMLAETRAALADVYAAESDDVAKRAGKAAVLAAAAGCLDEMSDSTGIEGYRRLATRLNNAYLASLATYEDKQGAFVVLFADAGGDWSRFFAAVDEVAELSDEARSARVATLLKRAAASAGSGQEQVATEGDDAGAQQVQCEALSGHGLDGEAAGGEHDHVRGGGYG